MDRDPNLISSNSDFLRNVQAAFKRHRSFGPMQSSSMLPRRSVLPQRETSRNKCIEVPPKIHNSDGHTSNVDVEEDASLTPPPISATITKFKDDHDQPPPPPPPHHIKDPKQHQMVDAIKKVKFSFPASAMSQGDGRMTTTRLGNLSSHMDSLALTEMEWEAVNQAELSNAISNEPKHQIGVNSDGDGVLRTDGGCSLLGTRMPALQNQLHHLRNFLQNDAVVSSCATTTSVHATSAPIRNSTTHMSCPHKDSEAVGSLTDAILKSQNIGLRDSVQEACPTHVSVSGADAERLLSGAQASSSLAHAPKTQNQVLTDLSHVQGDFVKDRGQGDDASTVPPSCPSSKDLSSHPKLETTKSEKQEKAPSRKKGYDPDLFFKVNGKLYQRLGKIGSGGSSEVHKVISSDCRIYALKKIKLKGRDYSTALGFCQEIVYLKKLKGKDNIIQLIDYEVTDKSLLQEVMNGPSSNNKNNKVKDDGFIYMVLEYGEIDLAHMLSQKWKEMEHSNSTMDENWLRFYWQQILLAVNTIHEERIVHSDLKPANFLVVKGSLKLIDFGIAKAIMSDTTNIQRDAQVGTLSYMSPEAFMCNETDANGNIIKCGRSSDIWSLGCILYQMVYGKTPFSEYKTFWSKFKVITDPNHKITYGPVSNPCLIDLMKKCLAWERNDRWRIPQLLKHPFLVPPLQTQPVPNDDNQVSTLCSKLQSVLGDIATASRPDQLNILSQISIMFHQLKELITNTN